MSISRMFCQKPIWNILDRKEIKWPKTWCVTAKIDFDSKYLRDFKAKLYINYIFLKAVDE